MKNSLVFSFLLSCFCSCAQNQAPPHAIIMGAYDAQADTTHGLAVLLYETMTTTSLPGGGTAVNKSVRIEPLRGYLLRNGDTLTLHRRSGGEIPLEDCILFKPDKKNGKH